jgi:hypothetical protein
VGSLAHRVFSRHLDSGPIAPAEFVQACREEIGSSSLNGRMADLYPRPSDLAAAIEEARALYDRFAKLPTKGFEGAEIEITHEPAADVELVGTVDAIYRADLGGHRLVDWKTGDIGDSEDQLSFYALLWALDRGEIPVRVEAVSVKTGDIHRTEPSESDVSAVALEVAAIIDKLRQAWEVGSTLNRRPGPWCRFCPILEECPEGQSAKALIG